MEIGPVGRGQGHWAQVVLRGAGDRMGAGLVQPVHREGGGEKGGIQMWWCPVCWRALQRTWSTMVSGIPFPRVARSQRALTIRLVQLLL